MQRNSGTFRLSSASLHDMTLIIVIQLLLHLFLTAKACTEIRVTTEDKSTVVIDRSMEWSSDLRSDIIVEPQEYFYEVDLSTVLTAPILIMLMHHFKTGQIDTPSSTSMLTAGMLPVIEWIARDWLWVRFINLTLPSTRYISSPNNEAYKARVSRSALARERIVEKQGEKRPWIGLSKCFDSALLPLVWLSFCHENRPAATLWLSGGAWALEICVNVSIPHSDYFFSKKI